MDWLRSRLDFLQYLSLHIVVGLVLSLVSLGVFAKMAEEMLEGTRLVYLDRLLAHSIHANATPLANTFFLTITRFGYEILLLVMFLFSIYFIFKRQWMPLLILLVTIQGGQYFNHAMKSFFLRPRPTFDDPIITALYYSFPSGHAMLSFTGYGLLAAYLVKHSPSRPRKLLIITAAAILIGLIGLSRIYLGVHYLSDVIAGYAAGAFWLSTCITALYFIPDSFRHNPSAKSAKVYQRQ